MALRIKTKQEFEEEFGKNWRNLVEYSFPEDMDYLLGRQLLIDEDARMLSRGQIEKDRWGISSEMVKEIDEEPAKTRRANEFDTINSIPPKISCKIKGNLVRVKLLLGSHKFSADAKCSPEDEFNLQTGLAIALYRLARKVGEYDKEVIKIEKHNVIDDLLGE